MKRILALKLSCQRKLASIPDFAWRPFWMPAFAGMTICILMSFTLVSCSSRNIRSTALLSHDLLFPLGVYKHNVKIKTTRTLEHESQKFTFQGVVKISVDRIDVVGLSPFGATLFKLSEERGTGQVEFESFIDAFKGHESKFKEYYAVLKLLLTAPHDFSESFEVMPNTKFMLKKYDKNGIPQQIAIKHPKFSIDITVIGYDI